MLVLLRLVAAQAALAEVWAALDAVAQQAERPAEVPLKQPDAQGALVLALGPEPQTWQIDHLQVSQSA